MFASLKINKIEVYIALLTLDKKNIKKRESQVKLNTPTFPLKPVSLSR